MRDYILTKRTGEQFKIAVLPTYVINRLLTCGFNITGVNGNATKDDLIERLRLELFIREHDLRR